MEKKEASSEKGFILKIERPGGYVIASSKTLAQDLHEQLQHVVSAAAVAEANPSLFAIGGPDWILGRKPRWEAQPSQHC